MDWRSGVGQAAFVAWTVLAPTVQAFAPPAVNARVEISAAVAGSSATLEAIERQANARHRVRQQEIAALQARLAEAEARGAAEDARLQAQLIEAREALVADLASRDRAYAEEIAVFRREVTSIASTADGAAALARFNAGDRVGAIAVLDQLRRARDAARQARADIESAAEARQIATLALDARGKSDPAFDTGAVITRYEEVVQLDPGEYNDWEQLVMLYSDAGRRDAALAGTERLEALATNDQNRSVALTMRADLLLSQGNRDGALGLYRRSLDINERLSAANPTSADIMRNVGVLLTNIGDVLLSAGDRDGALELYRRSLDIDERLSTADPASASLARDLSASLTKIGDLLLSQGERDVALDLYRRGLEIAERLSAADPTSAVLAMNVSLSLPRIGDVLLSQGDRDGALELYRRSLEIAERLSAGDPSSAVLKRNVSVSLDRIGDVLVSQGDQNGALDLYRRGLEIDERLSEADAASTKLARGVSVSLIKIGDVLSSQGDRDGALVLFRRSQAIAERLSAADPESADLARDVTVLLGRIGDVLVSQGDHNGALNLYRRGLEIDERLSAADPASADKARDVFVSYIRMAKVTGERRHWERALTILQDLEAKGTLFEADRPFIAQLEGILAGTASVPNRSAESGRISSAGSAPSVAAAAGSVIQGELTNTDARLADNSFYDCQVVQTDPGTLYRAIMRSDAFDTYLAVGTGECGGTPTWTNDDGAGGTNSAIDFLGDGRAWFVRANSLAASTTGSYTLEISQTALLAVEQTARGELTSGDPVLSDGSFYDCHPVQTAAGAAYQVTMRSSEFDTYLSVGSVQCAGEASVNDDDGGGGTNSSLSFNGDGRVWFVRANSLEAAATGTYSLELTSGAGGGKGP